MEENEEGGGRGGNFDLESKHMIFAYQVLGQSRGKGRREEKKKRGAGLQMQKVKLDAHFLLVL